MDVSSFSCPREEIMGLEHRDRRLKIPVTLMAWADREEEEDEEA